MKQTILAISVLTLGVVLYVSTDVKPSRDSATEVQTEPNPIANNTITSPVGAAYLAADDTPPTIGDPVAEAPPQRETEEVFGLTVYKDRNCEIQQHYLVNDDGSVTEAFSCEPFVKTIGPYDHYTTESLEALAYADAEAAYEVGRRLLSRAPKKATRYLLRSIALAPLPDGGGVHLAPLRMIVTERFRKEATIDGDLQAMRNMHLYYALGTLLDPDYAFYSDESHQLLLDAGVSADAIEEVEQRSQMFRQELASIQQEVFGESWIAEEQI